MRSDKRAATKLRLQGATYAEISKQLQIPKSTLSSWLKNLVLSEAARSRITTKYTQGYKKGLLKKAQLQTHLARKRQVQVVAAASKSIHRLTKEGLLLVGAALYWGEGYKKLRKVNGKIKTVHPVSLSNADPVLIKAFVKFLVEVCEVPKSKIKAGIRMYQHQNELELQRFWMAVTTLPKSQFTKSYIGISKSSLGKRPYNTLPHGTIQITVYDTALFYRVIGWIEGIKRQL